MVGANARVGLENNLYLSRGLLATNAEFVQRAIENLERIGWGAASDKRRERLKLKVHVK
ncbi:3-keto-5-aminohexanoate cleavage protein [Bradyrhizobium sp. 521_C7_N1_3]|uniref:3-keto-5-aminohexanoate cleavage protein n=1 Tax=Bradyrhizobium sp. 521_C7_N1_3 TaxID=3240368 RepID=UPI003F89B750